MLFSSFFQSTPFFLETNGNHEVQPRQTSRNQKKKQFCETNTAQVNVHLGRDLCLGPAKRFRPTCCCPTACADSSARRTHTCHVDQCYSPALSCSGSCPNASSREQPLSIPCPRLTKWPFGMLACRRRSPPTGGSSALGHPKYAM